MENENARNSIIGKRGWALHSSLFGKALVGRPAQAQTKLLPLGKAGPDVLSRQFTIIDGKKDMMVALNMIVWDPFHD